MLNIHFAAAVVAGVISSAEYFTLVQNSGCVFVHWKLGFCSALKWKILLLLLSKFVDQCFLCGEGQNVVPCHKGMDKF